MKPIMKVSEQQFRWALAAVLVTCSASGCVRRRLLVRTNPPGALVSVDNQIIGTSPAASSFTYYGPREIRVEAPGYRTETILRRLNPPWYELPGIDFVAETLWPFEIRDERIIDVELVPQEVTNVDEVLGRAGTLRDKSRSGVVAAPNISVTPPPVVNPSRAPALVPVPAGSLPPGGVALP